MRWKKQVEKEGGREAEKVKEKKLSGRDNLQHLEPARWEKVLKKKKKVRRLRRREKRRT